MGKGEVWISTFAPLLGLRWVEGRTWLLCTGRGLCLEAGLSQLLLLGAVVQILQPARLQGLGFPLQYGDGE